MLHGTFATLLHSVRALLHHGLAQFAQRERNSCAVGRLSCNPMSDLFTAGSLHPSACNASGRDVASVHRCALARLASDGVPRAEYEFRGGRGDALASFQSDACSHFYDALAPRSRRIADPFVTTVSRSLVVTEDLHPGGATEE